MKKLVMFLLLSASLSSFATLSDGSWSGKSTRKVMGTAGTTSTTVSWVFKSNAMTVTVTNASVATVYAMQLKFTPDDFFSLSGSGIVKGGGYCFKTVCHMGAQTTSGYMQLTWVENKKNLQFTGSTYNTTTKAYTAFEGKLKSTSADRD